MTLFQRLVLGMLAWLIEYTIKLHRTGKMSTEQEDRAKSFINEAKVAEDFFNEGEKFEGERDEEKYTARVDTEVKLEQDALNNEERGNKEN
jgi:hypothetical protein